jgi:hypothetical protein
LLFTGHIPPAKSIAWAGSLPIHSPVEYSVLLQANFWKTTQFNTGQHSRQCGIILTIG